MRYGQDRSGRPSAFQLADAVVSSQDPPVGAISLDQDLVVRLRDVLERRPTTEAELRRLAEESDACERLLQARLERRESELDELSAGAGSITEIASTLTEIRGLRSELEELRGLLEGLDAHARFLRGRWALGEEAPVSEAPGRGTPAA
jgi:chromosome segregation ATPase